MRPNDMYTVMYYYKEPFEAEAETVASPLASSRPSSTTSSTMFWGLNQRVHNTMKQTKELSSQSERQIRLIQAITKSQNQHEREQHLAMSSLLCRIEQSEQNIQGLQNATQTLSNNQQQTEQNVRILQTELEELKKQFRAQQQQQPQRRSVQNSSQMQESRHEKQQQFLGSHGNPAVAPPEPGIVFTDVYGRRRRFCRYCGENLAANYCLRHERNEVCRRRGSYSSACPSGSAQVNP